MNPRDFLLLVGICLIWAMNNIISKLVVSMWHVPPLFYAAVRFAIVAAVTLPWLRPMPRPAWRIVAIGLLMGGGSFALMFVALKSSLTTSKTKWKSLPRRPKHTTVSGSPRIKRK